MDAVKQAASTTITYLQKPPVRRFFIFIVMVLSWAQIWIGMQTVATYGVEIMAQLGINNATLALISNIVTIAVGVGCLVSGMIGAKIGGKSTVIIGLAICFISGLLFFVFTPTNIGFLIALRILEGFGGGLINGYTVNMIGAWFPRRERAFALGLQMGLYGVAVATTVVFCDAFNAVGFGWSQSIGAFLMSATAICLVLAVFILKDINKVYGVEVIDQALPGHDQVEDEGKAVTEIEHKPATYSQAFKSAALWIVAGGICLLTANQYNLQFVFPMILPEWHYDAAQITFFLGTAFLGTIIAAPLGGLLSDRVFKGKRWQVMVICFAGTLIFTIIFMIVGNIHIDILGLLVIGFVLFAVSDMAVGVMYAIPPEIFDPSFFARANGIVLLSCNIIGLLSVILSGVIADATGSYFFALGLCIILSALGILCGIMLHKKYNG